MEQAQTELYIDKLFQTNNQPTNKTNEYKPTNESTHKPEAHGPQRSTIYEDYIQPKYCKCCMQLIKFSSLDLIHMVVRGLLKEPYFKTFVKIPKIS